MSVTVPTATASALTEPQPAGPCERDPGWWELLRSLGAAVLSPPQHSGAVWDALALERPDAVAVTDAFLLGLPPHAAIYLGPEGKLGGEGLGRVQGFWRALGLAPAEDADHLGSLLMLYAELGEAAQAAQTEAVALKLGNARAALLHEHLASWVPAYLSALGELTGGPIAQWAELVRHTLTHEASLLPPPPRLPLAMREAAALPTGPDELEGRDELLDRLVCPVHSGVIISQQDLRRAAAGLGMGLRRGERRYALKALLEQDPAATLSWYARFADNWVERHEPLHADYDSSTSDWWRERAGGFAAMLRAISDS